MGFTVNQVRHFYVATKPKEGELVVKHEGTEVKDKLKKTESVGTIKAHINKDKDHLYFEYMTPGGPERSDLINLSKIDYIKVTKAKDMRYPLKQVKVSFKDNPQFKGEAIFTIGFKGFLSLSEEDMQFVVAGHSEDTPVDASVYYKEIAVALAKSVDRGYTGMVKVELETGGTSTDQVATLSEVTASTKIKDLTDTYTGIVITELQQPWSRGLRHQGLGVWFDFSGVTRHTDVKVVTESYVAPKDLDNRAVKNGYKIADMEWFYHGTRGDIYRGVNYPYHIETEYVANPENEYDVLDIHYAFIEQGTQYFNSEKDITIAADEEVVNAIKDAIKEEAKAKNVVIDEC